MVPRILAIGGGGFLMEDAPVEHIEKFYAAYERLGCEPAHLAFFRKPFRTSIPLADFADSILAQDVLFVGGGNTRSALGVWREWGLDRVFAEAWQRGILLAGMSAGAMCWFEQGLTDSYWGAGLQPLQCLGLLPGGCCVHYGSEPKRRIRLHEEVAAGVSGQRVAIDDGAAILYAHRNMQEVVSWLPDATAYLVASENGKVTEHACAARPIA
jgi:dipeptidase E